MKKIKTHEINLRISLKEIPEDHPFISSLKIRKQDQIMKKKRRHQGLGSPLKKGDEEDQDP